MNKNNKLEDSLNKIFTTSDYKMVDVSSKEVTYRKALATEGNGVVCESPPLPSISSFHRWNSSMKFMDFRNSLMKYHNFNEFRNTRDGDVENS